MPATTPLPPRPDLVLRVAFAGNITLAADAAPLRVQALDAVLAVLAQQLAALPPPPPDVAQAERLTDYYADQPPLLRLVTGLAEGSDDEAAAALARLAARQVGEAAPARPVRTELAAVLGCDVASYRASRPPSYRPAFDQLVEQCAYVLALDGHYQPGEAGAADRRQLYRAQSMFLLRQADLLIAAADPQQASRPGSTVDTLRQALRFGLPVVFIHVGTGRIDYLAPGADPTPLLEADPDFAATDWQAALAAWVSATIDGPDLRGEAGSNALALSSEEQHILKEYFAGHQVPHYFPAAVGEGAARQPTRQERYWNWLEGSFSHQLSPGRQVWRWLNARLNSEPAPGKTRPAARSARTLYEQYRNRAADLGAHYAGRYRGTFSGNYTLAILVAVFVAAGVVLLYLQANHRSPELPWVDVLLELGKLLCLGLIFYFTMRAQEHRWNDRAVDYRYLSERLQAMRVLPTLGSFQPPSAASLHFASRVVRQSVVEWLFKAIVRAVPPRAADVRPSELALGDQTLRVRLLTCAAPAGLAEVQSWLTRETNYHQHNTGKMARLNTFLKEKGTLISWVLAGLLAANFLGLLLLPPWHDAALRISAGFSSSLGPAVIRPYEPIEAEAGYFQHLYQWAAPLLLAAAVILPIIVASFSGIRLQSEARRLAERSFFLGQLLQNRQRRANLLSQQLQEAPAKAWNAKVLALGEEVAADHVQEITEWSVVYAKELLES